IWIHFLPTGGDRLQAPQTTVLRVLALHMRRSVHNWRILPSVLSRLGCRPLSDERRSRSRRVETYKGLTRQAEPLKLTLPYVCPDVKTLIGCGNSLRSSD